jgi:hypothetical protein
MARKRQLLAGRKDAHAHPIALFSRRIARKNERRLRKVCLTRKRLHLVIRETLRIVKDSQGIALQWAFCKDIKDRITQCARHPSMLPAPPQR